VLDQLIAVIWRGQTGSSCSYLAVEAVSDGWFYSADLLGEQTTIAFLTDSDLYRRKHKIFPDLWRRRINQTVYARERLSPDADLSRLRIVSAASIIRVRSAGKNWCAVGDAALSHDPLSGVGVLHALESGARAAAAIVEFLVSGKPLRSYESWIAGRSLEYLRSRRHYYGEERRWRSSPFWERRRSALGAEPSILALLAPVARSSGTADSSREHFTGDGTSGAGQVTRNMHR
jgi:flavin-dependent dehydrogenase